ncbi:sensor histidine kinase [Peredibacter starrii]|uniref:histidine kinase n=1 Tax=Peredibacter starrii TaxID=28202 RepID=A0AAX4HKP6_9BACT|nr:GAF domain-containing sensor histidine kinase [Peredibacter starrii]WPU63765.1 GAF domain-containing sensor histidine kinase [Peredibacter starrii]
MNVVQQSEVSHRLIQVIHELSLARDLQSIVDIIRHAARELTGADGATFVLRDGDKCYYVDEDAITPLWKGLRFPLKACVSGWAMLNKQNVIIPDIYNDPRVPVDAYKPTFVKSMVMIPIRKESPIGAIGNYWAKPHEATSEEIKILESLADTTAISLQNIQLLSDLTHQLNLRDEFISISAHELRTPLTPLNLQLGLLSKHLKGQSPKVDLMLDKARTQLNDFSKLIDNLLDVSRIHLGQFSHQKVRTELCKIVQDNVNLLRLSSKGEITMNCAMNIWGEWDEERIGQVVRNLILNAIKFGEGKLIEVEVRTEQAMAVFSVKDHGMGISRADQARIFRRFERAHDYKNFGGMGLGLYVVSKILEDHGGDISVESELNEGSTFTVRLPITH